MLLFKSRLRRLIICYILGLVLRTSLVLTINLSRGPGEGPVDFVNPIQKILNCFRLQSKRTTIRFRKDGVWVFEVENKDDLQHIIIPFFKKFHFISHKKTLQFNKFVKIFYLIQQTPSLTLAHVTQILQWRNESQTKKR